MGCRISKSKCGVEAVSSQPLILMNHFKNNYENGVVTIAKNGLRCDALIKLNEIERNKENGILCSGEQNFSRIEKNPLITKNKRSGIKVIDGCHIGINHNKIESNFGQGILLVESTSAHIERNFISSNYKANIAYGGERSADTVIINNTICSSRAEGIFLISSGFSWIRKNNIYDNSDGIVMFDACPHVTSNHVNENQRAGFVICGSSFPKIEKNTVYGNTQSGINIRDNS